MSLRDAYLLCKKHRPICFPNLGFWNQLIAYESQLKKENSVKSKNIFLHLFLCLPKKEQNNNNARKIFLHICFC